MNSTSSDRRTGPRRASPARIPIAALIIGPAAPGLKVEAGWNAAPAEVEPAGSHLTGSRSTSAQPGAALLEKCPEHRAMTAGLVFAVAADR